MNEVKKVKRLWLFREMFYLVMVSLGVFFAIVSNPFITKSGVAGYLASLFFGVSTIGALFFLIVVINGFFIRSEEIEEAIEEAEERREKNIKGALVYIANEGEMEATTDG